MGEEFKSKLHETTIKFPQTEIWNDSCAISELKYSIDNGSVGATTNPVIVNQVLKQEFSDWQPLIKELSIDNPTATEDEIAWLLMDYIGKESSKLLLPIFEKNSGRNGRLSMQTNPKYYLNAEKMLSQAKHFNTLAPNIQVKIPASGAGIKAIEEAIYNGVSINATVSFTVSQAIGVAEAVERGLNRRENEGLSNDNISAICTIMLGRVDDYLKNHCSDNNIVVDADILEWAGVAVVKNAYKVFNERNYRTGLLTAAYRNHYHWSQFIGGNISMTIPYKWQVKLNNSSIEVVERINEPVKEEILIKLMNLDEFRKAYDINALTSEEFQNYGAFKATIKQFLNGYDELIKQIRSVII